MVLGHRGGEQVEADRETLPVTHDLGVVGVYDLARRDPELLGLDRDRGAVGVGAGDHEHVVADETVIASEDIGRQVSATQMPQVQRP
jgi:hypothetical protein